jgi:hypothetical protein
MDNLEDHAEEAPALPPDAKKPQDTKEDPGIPKNSNSGLGGGESQQGSLTPAELEEIYLELQHCRGTVAEILQVRGAASDARDFELASVLAKARKLISKKNRRKVAGVMEECLELINSKICDEEVRRYWLADETMRDLLPYTAEFGALPIRVTQVRPLAGLPLDRKILIWRICDERVRNEVPKREVLMWEVEEEVAKLGSWFSLDAIKDLSGMINRLRQQSDAVSAFLWKELKSLDQQILVEYEPSELSSKQAQDIVCQALNKIIAGPSFFESERFEGVSLRQEITDLMKQLPTGRLRWPTRKEKMVAAIKLGRLNRLLLEAAYPVELSRNHNLYASEITTTPIECQKIPIVQLRLWLARIGEAKTQLFRHKNEIPQSVNKLASTLLTCVTSDIQSLLPVDGQVVLDDFCI